MSKSSKHVINWRKRTKERIVKAMGGKCYICGYDRCYAAMDLHHINPDEKNFSMGGMRANPIAWIKIVEELRKCILLCSNCHREVEYGMVDVINPKSTFNEEYVEYNLNRFSNPQKNYILKCKQCKETLETFTKTQKFCSDVCYKIYNEPENRRKRKARNTPRKVEWPTPSELEEMLKTMTWVAIGRKYGVSDNAVRKWAKKYGLI